MKKELGKELPLSERAMFLADNADAVENLGYMKSFEPDEVQSLKDQLAEAAIKVDTLKQELDDIKATYKDKMKPHQKIIGETLKNIKEGAEFVEEDCYKFIDHTEGMVGYYNKFGDLVQSRKIRADERQKTIFAIERTGTND